MRQIDVFGWAVPVVIEAYRTKGLEALEHTPYAIRNAACGRLLSYRRVTPLEIDRDRQNIMRIEWRLWEKYYQPPEGLKGATVLDAGCGCGESTYFDFLKGAKKVVAVESDRDAAERFRRNAKRLNWNVEFHERRFELQDLLDHDFDFVKVDIEGGEESCLALDKLPRGTYEVHGKRLIRLFKQRYPKARWHFSLQHATPFMLNW